MDSTIESENYNGWKNYPTWAVNLWLSNDKGLYNATRELVTNEFDPSARRYATGNAIRDFVCNNLAPDLGASFAADLLGYALDCVDWYEIADAWLED